MLAMKALISTQYCWSLDTLGLETMCMHESETYSHSKEGNTYDAKAQEKGVGRNTHILRVHSQW